MKLPRGVRERLLVAVVGAGLLVTPKPAHPQTTDVIGEYECTEARVAGKSVPCKAAQLSLKSDGHFELQGREGLVSGYRNLGRIDRDDFEITRKNRIGPQDRVSLLQQKRFVRNDLRTSRRRIGQDKIRLSNRS